MTLAPPARPTAPPDADRPGRFRFDGVPWSFYEAVDAEAGPGSFVTFDRGTLEVMTVSALHDATSRVVYSLIRVLAEETDLPMRSIGSATLRLPERDVGLQGDETFYFGENVARMQPTLDRGEIIRLPDNPPPDLAIEVEVTQRLGSRVGIYREMRVPEVWRYDGSLTILTLANNTYESSERSRTFPQLSPQELAGFIADGVRGDETTVAKRFRRRVIEVSNA